MFARNHLGKKNKIKLATRIYQDIQFQTWFIVGRCPACRIDWHSGSNNPCFKIFQRFLAFIFSLHFLPDSWLSGPEFGRLLFRPDCVVALEKTHKNHKNNFYILLRTIHTKPYKYCIIMCYHVPAVPHKAAAEILKIGHYRRGELLWCMDGRANPMDRKVVAVVAMVCNGHLTRSCWM